MGDGDGDGVLIVFFFFFLEESGDGGGKGFLWGEVLFWWVFLRDALLGLGADWKGDVGGLEGVGRRRGAECGVRG